MMYRSKKALDLLRDPRCVLHNTVSDPNGSEPEVKVYGRAISGGEEAKSRYRRAYANRWKRAAPKPFPGHVFSVEIESVTSVRYDTKRSVMIVRHWDAKEGMREFRRHYP